MCQKCKDAFDEFYPNITEEEFQTLLWNVTPFPAGEPEDIRNALKEAKENSDGTVDGAVAYAHEQMSAAMDQLNRDNDPDNYLPEGEV